MDLRAGLTQEGPASQDLCCPLVAQMGPASLQAGATRQPPEVGAPVWPKGVRQLLGSWVPTLEPMGC